MGFNHKVTRILSFLAIGRIEEPVIFAFLYKRMKIKPVSTEGGYHEAESVHHIGCGPVLG